MKMGLEQHWEAHCDKCGNWARIPRREGTPKNIALEMGWRKYGTKWMCAACARNTLVTQKVQQLATTSPNGLTYGCQACWDDINGDAHEAHCHRSSHGMQR